MRPITTLCTTSLSLFLACGPISPPLDADSGGDESTTSAAPSTTTAIPPEPTTTTITTTAVSETTGTPEPATSSDTTLAHEFIVNPDGGTGGTQCDVFKQDCDPGEKCVPWAEGGGSAWNASKCVDITGDGAPGEPCFAPEGGAAGIDDCASGAICWDIDETNHGSCIAQCLGSPENPLCPASFSCAIAGDGVLALCIPNCDPLVQDCPGTNLCVPNGDQFLCVLDASGDAGATNDPCEFANACDKGLICLNTSAASSACEPGATGCCQPYCTFPDSPCPNPDQQCVQWYDPMMEIPPGAEDIGVCAIAD